MHRKLYKSILLSPIVLLSACAGKEHKEEKTLNIIHIMTDDHSYQTISAYDHPLSHLAPTPNIDRLAEEGMLFHRAFVENSLSTPSRACLMTGLYSHQNGQKQLGEGIDTTKTFFSELLKEKGYQTAVVGKWHMLCEPKGFDYYSILWDQGDYYNPEFRTNHTQGEYVKEEGYATTLTTDYALDFLNHRDKDKPFCLLVHHKAPHRNWMPEPQYFDLYEEVTFPYPSTFDDDYSSRCMAAHQQEMQIDRDMTFIYDLKLDSLKHDAHYQKEWNVDGWEASLDRMTPEQREQWLAAYEKRYEDFVQLQSSFSEAELKKWKYQHYLKDYLRCIKSIDDEIGRLIEYLEKEGLMENTVIAYTSDQGFYMGEHGWFDKRFMYEESFRTPLIIRYPGKEEGISTQLLVQNIDFAPTYLDVAGIEKPQEMSGRSLVPLLSGKKPTDWRKDLYYHFYDYPAIHQVLRHDGVRDERFKLIHFYTSDEDKEGRVTCDELYDLQEDPNELNNLYGKEGYEETTLRLQKRLDEYRKELKVDEF